MRLVGARFLRVRNTTMLVLPYFSLYHTRHAASRSLLFLNFLPRRLRGLIKFSRRQVIRERYDMSRWVGHGARMLGNRGHFRMPESACCITSSPVGLFCNLREGRVFYMPCRVYRRHHSLGASVSRCGDVGGLVCGNTLPPKSTGAPAILSPIESAQHCLLSD